MTNDGLVGFRRVGGIEGVQLVPDLAVSLPTPTDAGRTYTFRLRKGIRYSTGKPVQPADFRAAIERLLEAKIGGADAGTTSSTSSAPTAAGPDGRATSRGGSSAKGGR